MSKWEMFANKRPWLKQFVDEGLKWAMKYYNRLDKTTAYVVAMCKCRIVFKFLKASLYTLIFIS